MKRAIAGLAIFLAAAACAFSEEAVKADLAGGAEVWGIAESGVLPEDSLSQYARHNVTGSVKVASSGGQVHRVETYLEWDGVNEAHYQVWETLYVSGGTYTGWSERYLRTRYFSSFSRKAVSGAIQQEIKPNGSGFVEWTITGADAATDDSGSATSVNVVETGAFDGVSDRRIEIETDGDDNSDNAKVKLTDSGYSRFIFDRKKLGQKIVTITQKISLEGEGHGNMGYDPEENDDTDSAGTTQPAATGE